MDNIKFRVRVILKQRLVCSDHKKYFVEYLHFRHPFGIILLFFEECSNITVATHKI